LAALAGWIFLLSKFDGDFMGLVEILAILVFFWLIMEAAAKANPGQVESPLGRFLGRYSNRRDKVVVCFAFLAVLAVLFLTSFLHGNLFLTIVVSVTGTVAAYYGICRLFGTQELRDQVLPEFIKRTIFPKDPVDK
jgi:hypothetical protein